MASKYRLLWPFMRSNSSRSMTSNGHLPLLAQNVRFRSHKKERKAAGSMPALTTILPPLDDTSAETDELDKQIQKLDALLADVNLNLAEQQEQLAQEAVEMQRQFGVVLPADYTNLIRGGVDPNCPPSKYPCVGCGAPIHCAEPHLPGFISNGKFKAMTDLQKQNCKCLRCQGLEHHSVLLDAKVSVDEYRQILSQVRHQRSVILHVIDVSDYRNGLIPDLLDIVGNNHPIYVIANKIDLLPRDSKGYLHHIRDCVTQYSTQLYGSNLKQVYLASALTGYGIEPIVSKVLSQLPRYKCNVHLVGCTNSGKSTLFNTLLLSDLCKVRARDQIGKATTSIWPGTTLNLLRFPLALPTGQLMALRAERLKAKAEFERSQAKLSHVGERKERNIHALTLRGLVDFTDPNSQMNDDVSVDFAGISHEGVAEDQELSHHYRLDRRKGQLIQHKQEHGTLDYKAYSQSKWLFDTPGLISSEQIINKFGMTDLKRLLMKRMSLPRTFSLRCGMTMFIGGVARIDYLQSDVDSPQSTDPGENSSADDNNDNDGSDNRDNSILLTVIAANGLPVNVCPTNDADQFYSAALEKDSFMVPSADSFAEMDALVGHDFEIDGAGFNHSLTDIQLSSVGWVAVACASHTRASLRAYTPGGVGCHTRPSLLPHAVSLRGKRIRGTRAYMVKKPRK